VVKLVLKARQESSQRCKPLEYWNIEFDEKYLW
jgi:hypothetical protein